MQIADVARRFEESRKSVPVVEVDSDVVQGGSEGVGGVGGGAVGEGGSGVDLAMLGDLPDKSDEEEAAAEVLTSLTAVESASSVGGGPVPQSTGEEGEEEVVEVEGEPGERPRTGSRRSSKKKRGRPKKSKKVPRHLFVKQLTDEQEQDL